jgi:hypothetical protein
MARTPISGKQEDDSDDKDESGEEEETSADEAEKHVDESHLQALHRIADVKKKIVKQFEV